MVRRLQALTRIHSQPSEGGVSVVRFQPILPSLMFEHERTVADRNDSRFRAVILLVITLQQE